MSKQRKVIGKSIKSYGSKATTFIAGALYIAGSIIAITSLIYFANKALD